uniref:G_PROTEIN_RECEP_F1_2 domain-containing protein n=1 Tax=Caenorhabditis japonica TaxID=281687 RepID=A0A8R1HRP7_CAEJA
MTPFADCPGYFTPSLELFSVCSNVTDFCGHVKDFYKIDQILQWAVFIVPCVMCTIAFFLNAHNFYVLIPMFRSMDDRTKKRYVFLISRILSATMSQISIFLVPIAMHFTDFNFWAMAVFLVFDMLSFLSFLGGIVGTTLTLYVVIVHPVFYQREFSYQRCLKIVVAFWVCSAIVAIGCGTVQAAFMSEDSPFKCDYHTCEMPVLVFSIVCISVTFTISLAIQFFVIISLACHQRKSQQRGDYSSTAKQLIGVKRSLISAFFVFLIMAVFEVTSAIILLQNVVNIANHSASLCEMFESSDFHSVFRCFRVQIKYSVVSFLKEPVFSLVVDNVALSLKEEISLFDGEDLQTQWSTIAKDRNAWNAVIRDHIRLSKNGSTK